MEVAIVASMAVAAGEGGSREEVAIVATGEGLA